MFAIVAIWDPCPMACRRGMTRAREGATKWWLWTIVLTGALSCGGCEPSPTDEPFLKVRPKVGDLLGTWCIETTARAYLSKQGYDVAASRLVLRGDGSYSLAGMPNWFEEHDQRRRTVCGSSGKWVLASNVSGWYVRLKPDRGDGRHWENDCVLAVRRQRPPYLLYGATVDPDTDRAVFFMRVPGRSASN